MAGLANRVDGRAIYLNITKGKIQMRVPEKTDTSVPHVITKGINEGKTVYYEQYDELTGVLESIEVKQSDFSKDWVFKIKVGGDTYLLQAPYSSSVSTQLLKRLPNIDVNKEITIATYYLDDDKKQGKKKTVAVVYQNGKKCEIAFTKDKPNGLPELAKIKVKGVDTWDDTDQLLFFEKLVAGLNFAKPVATEVDGEEEGGDIPF